MQHWLVEHPVCKRECSWDLEGLQPCSLHENHRERRALTKCSYSMFWSLFFENHIERRTLTKVFSFLYGMRISERGKYIEKVFNTLLRMRITERGEHLQSTLSVSLCSVCLSLFGFLNQEVYYFFTVYSAFWPIFLFYFAQLNWNLVGNSFFIELPLQVIC